METGGAIRQGLEITVEDAFAAIVQQLRQKWYSTELATFGYDVYIPNFVARYLATRLQVREIEALEHPQTRRLSPAFYDAAWIMCRRGILRPGVRGFGSQVVSDGCGGGGFSLTEHGREWLQHAEHFDYVLIEPGRVARLLAEHERQLGVVYLERAQEAVRCYEASAYIACCAMCGAAAEAIYIKLAAAKTGDEERVLDDLRRPGGRGKVEKLITAGLKDGLKMRLQGGADLLKYWRDAAAHGQRAGVAEHEAWTALLLLLRFAIFVTESWSELTAPAVQPELDRAEAR